MEMLLRWSAAKTWRSCTSLFSWPINVFLTLSTATSWEKGRQAVKHPLLLLWAVIFAAAAWGRGAGLMLSLSQGALVLHGDGWHRVLHWSQHHNSGQRTYRTNRVSDLCKTWSCRFCSKVWRTLRLEKCDMQKKPKCMKLFNHMFPPTTFVLYILINIELRNEKIPDPSPPVLHLNMQIVVNIPTLLAALSKILFILRSRGTR